MRIPEKYFSHVLLENRRIQNIKPFFFQHGIPLFLYTLITLIMVLLPIGIDLTSNYIGHLEVVFWSNYFWWFDYSTTHLFTNPLHDSYLFYPIGLDMVDSILPFVLFIPVTHLFGSVISYNVYLLLTFILAGYGMFLLANYLLDDVYIAFISGLIFAFSPFHFAAAFAHLHIFSIMWIPFVILFFLKMYEEPIFYHAVIAGFFFAVNALTSWTIAVMTTIFILIFILFNYRRTLERSFSLCLMQFTIVTLIIMSPGLYLILINYFNNPDMVKSLDSFIHYSADPLAFFIPSSFHPLFGSFTTSIYSQFTGNFSENTTFVGYSVIILSIIGFLSSRKNAIFRLFGVSLIIFFILSLGPFLHFNGIWKFTEANYSILLPGIITYYIPFVNMIRVPSRYDIMVMFCFAIIAGFGLQALIKKYQLTTRNKNILCGIISLIILCEFAAIISTQAVTPIPDFYFNVSQDRDYSIIELPLCDIYSEYNYKTMARYYEYQKIHQRIIFGGYWSRIAKPYDKFIQSDPVLNRLDVGYKDIINSPFENPLPYLSDEYNVRYVVIHPKLMQNETLDDIQQYLGNSFYMDNSVSSDPLIIYPVNNPNEFDYSNVENIIRMQLPGGWHGYENWKGIPSRWTSNNATMFVYSNRNKSVNLSFRTRSFYNPRTLEIYSNDIIQLHQIIPTSFNNISVKINLNAGNNSIRLFIPDGCDKPIDHPELRNNDTRCMSIVIQNVSIS